MSAPIRIGKRTRKRGALDKAIGFARTRAARIAAGPPVAPRWTAARDKVLALFSAHAGAPTELEEIALRHPWNAATLEPARALERARGAVGVVVITEGALHGGSNELLHHLRQALEAASGDARPALLGLDVFVDVAQIDRARDAGADGVVIVRRAIDDQLSRALIARAKERGLATIVECYVPSDVEEAIAQGVDAIAVSFRDRDHHRPSVAQAAAIAACVSRRAPLLGVSAHDLAPEEARRARALELVALSGTKAG